MIKEIQLSWDSRRERLRYGLGAVCIGIAALLLLLSFRGGAAQGLAAPLAPTAITIDKSSTTSIVDPADFNTASQAVAGEMVTVTVVYTVSDDTIYDASPRVALQDGLYPIGSSPTWSAMYTGTAAFLRTQEGSGNVVARDGALVIFPNQGIITGTDAITVEVYAVRTQSRYVASGEIGNGSALRIQAILRYCPDAAGCPSPSVANNDVNVGTIVAIQPQVDTSYLTPVYSDPANAVTGGSQVRLTVRATGTSGRPSAHDIVYTVTLGSGLTYSASYGDGVGPGTMSAGPAGVTYVAWNLPASLAAGNTWHAVITATLPNPLVIGSQFTYLGTAAYETFTGDVDYEGHYVRSGQAQTLSPVGVYVTKTSNPASGAVTMGDAVSYTVVIRQAANTLLNGPQVVDTQPLGFHYISDTFALENATFTTFVTEAGGTGNVYQNLRWLMSDFPSTDQPRVVTATYAVLNTGLDYNGAPVYFTESDFRSSRNSISSVTGAVLSWTPPPGSTYVAAARANAGTLGIIQPFMGDQFSTSRTDGGDREIGQTVNFAIRFHNLGALVTGLSIPAYELEVCDTLPTGLLFSQDNGCFVSGTTPPVSCTFPYTPPTIGDEGVVCWQVPELARTTTFYEFRYQASISPAAFPGVQTNGAHVTTYSSQPGIVEAERVYSEFPAALPAANCGATCITILGLEGNKAPWDTQVAPGDLLTYTLFFTDTSPVQTYTGLVVTDTYDTLLSFVAATPMPTSHDAGTRTLVWDLGALPDGSNQQIILTMRVASEIEARYTLTNTLTWDSAQTPPHTLSKVTPINVADLRVGISGSESTHAGGEVVLTVVYSNTGSLENAPITLTLDYGPYLTYVSASPLTPVAGTDNQVFVDTLPKGGVKTLTINLTTNAPLPYTLEEIVSAVELSSPGAPSQTDSWVTTLQRPIFEFDKTGPEYAATGLNQPIIYTFHVKNTGDYTATAILITDTWDAATTFFPGASGAWVEEAGQGYARYTIPSLAPGATAEVDALTVNINTIQDKYVNLAELGSAQTSVQETIEHTWSPSIQLSKAAYPDPAFPGRVLTYTLTYDNVGASTVSHAVITDTLPSDFSYQDHTADGAGCSGGWQFNITGQVATWRCTTLDLGASGELKIWGMVAATAEETWLENMAESDGAPPVPRRPMDEPLYTFVARPWLRVDKVGVPTHPVAPGDHVTYTLTYENYGSYAAYDVIIKDQLPAQLTFVDCDPACTHNAGLVTWMIGEVPVDASGEVTVYATVNAGTAGQTAVNSNYTIENTTIWQRLLPAETEQGGPVNTTILNPQLTLTKVAAPTVVQAVDDTIVYTITYANTGGGLLHNVIMTDVLDSYTAFTFASAGCSHTGQASGGTVTCQLGNLLNGDSREVVIRVRVLPGLNAGDAILNQAQGRTDEAPLTSSNATKVWYQIVGDPEITLTPTSFEKSADEGSTVVLQDTLTVGNQGNVNLIWSLEVTPTATTWLRVSIGGGLPGTSIVPQTTAPGASTPVTVYFDPTGLAGGTYTAWLRVLSNDTDRPDLLVPVTFTISSGYNIYLPLVLRNN